MRAHQQAAVDIPRTQSDIRAKCFHPTGRFIEFPNEAIEQSIPARFEQQVRRYANCLAVKTRDQTLTYAELNEAANRVAHAILTRCGEGAEPIALLLDHNAPLMAAILGVLKAGKIYVPLDATYPRARTSYMLEDSQAKLIVTNTKMRSLARELAEEASQVLNLEEIASSLSHENPGLPIVPEAFAYILYTSGSTGEPKGIVENHRNVLHFTMNYTNSCHLCADDRLTLLLSCTFSGSVHPIFSALLNGAALFLRNVEEEGVAHLADWLIQEEITVFIGGSVFRHFVGTLTGHETFPKLRLIYLGAEATTMRDVELYKKHFSADCLLVNSLGATEMKNFRKFFMDKDTPLTGGVVPVGYPVDDNEVLLLDEAGHEVGFNRIGEIAVKSRYIAPAYWRRPDLTSTTFLPDPAGGDARIYCTGDLGLMLPDDCLLHLGRKDFQVKIRGHRVELAEIEMALLDRGDIKEAVVVAREDHPGAQRLVAYLVPVSHPAPTVSDLRCLLQGKLPDYMIPAAFVMLDALPLTLTGKVDRHALPAPGRTRPSLTSPFVMPRTPTEDRLAQIWTEVLSLEQVGIHDNFLELGGHSLLAMQVASRVHDTFHVEVPLKSLFEAATVADMAEVIAEHQMQTVGDAALASLLAEVEQVVDDSAP
jgi:amino acid adenylation domain-containing protein